MTFNVWAISDLHLAKSRPEKDMSVFGSAWNHYMERIEDSWKKEIQVEDLVLIAGDITWANHLDEALTDLRWIDQLPGIKVMIRGNHDYWWSSLKKMKEKAPSSIHFIHNNSFDYQGIAVAGSRLWDDETLDFSSMIEWKGKRPKPKTQEQKQEDQKIYQKELERLELSLKQMNPNAKHRVVMVHYPPLGLDLSPTPVTDLLEKYEVQACLFGHLHSLYPNSAKFGRARGVDYLFTAADYLEFKPLLLKL